MSGWARPGARGLTPRLAVDAGLAVRVDRALSELSSALMRRRLRGRMALESESRFADDDGRYEDDLTGLVGSAMVVAGRSRTWAEKECRGQPWASARGGDHWWWWLAVESEAALRVSLVVCSDLDDAGRLAGPAGWPTAQHAGHGGMRERENCTLLLRGAVGVAYGCCDIEAGIGQHGSVWIRGSGLEARISNLVVELAGLNTTVLTGGGGLQQWANRGNLANGTRPFEPFVR